MSVGKGSINRAVKTTTKVEKPVEKSEVKAETTKKTTASKTTAVKKAPATKKAPVAKASASTIVKPANEVCELGHELPIYLM